jgi:hypothetical protein
LRRIDLAVVYPARWAAKGIAGGWKIWWTIPAGWLFRNTLRVRCSARVRHIFYELAANFII